MNWESVTALATAATAVVILLTVLLGARQLRITNAQLDQLRKATQLEGTLKIFDELTAPRFVDALRFVRSELSNRLNDESFREEVERPGQPDFSHHPEFIVLRQFEKMGTLIEHQLIDADTIFDFNVHEYVGAWKHLKPLVAIARKRTPTAFNYSEALCLHAERWLQQHYPAE